MNRPEGTANASADASISLDQKRRIRRNSLLLFLVAAGFFVAFVVASALRSQGI